MMNVTEKFLASIKNANSIVISTHIIPDADGIGSQIAICLALRALGKRAICVNEEPLLERYKYLDPENVVISYDDFVSMYSDTEIDLFMVVDTNSLDRIGDHMKALSKRAPNLLFVDHHPCSQEVIDQNCVDTSKAATGELAGSLITSLHVPISKEMALPLYTAILIDTSSFRYPTVTGDTHRLIGKLMDTGVRPPHAYNMIYGTKKLSYMKLLGKVLASAHNTKDEKIAWLTLTEDLLGKFHVDSEDTLAFINHLLVLDNIKVAIMFREMGSEIKVSLRSTGIIDVGTMARALGGGGHDHSAATIIKGELESVIKTTIEKIHAILLEMEKNETLEKSAEK